jgi:hypothetical protein
VNESDSERSRFSSGDPTRSNKPSLEFAARLGVSVPTRRWSVAKALVLVVLGCVAFFGLLIGASTIVAEDQFEARRERFQREGTRVVERVAGKKLGRRTPYLVIAPAGLPAFEGEPGPSDGRWVRAAPATYERFQVGDQVDLLRIGDDYFVEGDVFYQKFSPRKSFLVSAIGAIAFWLVYRLWKVGG